MGSFPATSEGWPPQHELLTAREVEKICEVGLATGELTDPGRPIGQRPVAGHPAREAVHIELLVLTDLDDLFHQSKGIQGSTPASSPSMPETTPFEICDRLTEAYADLSPIAATEAGVTGRDHLWDDFSPDGEAAKEELRARAAADLEPHLDHPDPVQATAARVVSGYLKSGRRLYESGHWKRISTTSTARFRPHVTPSTSCRRRGPRRGRT